ncbi:phosphate--AMP phosphotransferase [Staphylococcus pasteuri]|uniref:phosphate--AMP phosphotransferase n=1 Tax=Staphylococcus pasteuri TaxID=45972 RepID=UPI001E505EA1|nr:phosphate--AMP phosphotransferase [Staphylococcus pasteuri]MCD9066565.1 phosphate--AMP phosphotransferase [Staphylococcus pasteuri]WAE39818.1 phosphate--AMP phosphotransferase [Staphylococcus pasteuri]
MNKKIEELKLKAASLTRQTHELGIPIMILFEGMPASGKTRLSNELLLTFDAKYTQFISTKSPQYEDLRYQFLQKYWNTLPQKGHINIYFRSWYSHFLDYKENSIKQAYYKKSEKLVNQIKSFETMLQNDNYELIKFYIEVSEEKRQEHIQQTKDNLLMKWKVQEYEQVIPNETYLAEMRKFTHKDNQWEVIDYTQREVAFEKMYKHIIERLENAIKKSKRQQANKDGAFSKDFSTNMFDVKFEKISKKEYKEMIEPLQKRMREIQFALYERKIPLILTFEGMDAAGKGGNIKRIREKLDPTGYEVNGISAPTDVELAHHYLWRFAKEMPKTGHLEIFDRSWYGRVLVERVEGFADKEEWKRAYHEINEFEKMWTDEGAILLKFFLCLDKDEQLKRFKDREQDPNKQWKITDEDWRNRDKWDLYLEASHDMIKYTDTNYAPWFIVPADHKKTARVEVLKYIIRQCEKVLWGVKDY